jgi:1,4-dihydroxy-2-naphthoate polyprenyltransferase
MNETKNRIGIWLRAFRLHFVLPAVLPALLGNVIAWAQGHNFHVINFILVMVGVTLNSMGLNMLDDVVDFRNAVDHKQNSEKNPYSGGSGILTGGLLLPEEMQTASIRCFAGTALIGLYLGWVCGWPVLILSLIGLFSSIFYTVPPVKFGYRGFGELGLLVNFGPVIVLGAYYVQAGTFALEPLLASLILGFMMWSMIIVNEIPDYDEDRDAGKWNLVARFGRKAGLILYILGLIAAYMVLFIMVMINISNPFVLLGLISLPWSLHSMLVARRFHNNPLRIAPANLSMIKAHTIMGMCLVTSYLVHGFLLHRG